MRRLDVAVIGGGQAALAVGYYLRRTGLDYALLDEQEAPGGAWRRAWPSLRLFSPSQWSSLPGRLMPRGADEYPTRDETIAYLAEYERRYAIPVERPVHVTAIRRAEAPADGSLGAPLLVETATGRIAAAAVVSATGSWAAPVIPAIDGMVAFGGELRHSAHYAGPEAYADARVVVVGGGNSGAQIVAELSPVARVTWATLAPPRFLPDEVDGRYLFEQATARYQALRAGRTPPPPRSLGDVVAVASVRDARARGALDAVPMFTRFTARGVVWPDGRREEPIDAVILATGFRPALAHLTPLGVIDADGRVATNGTRSATEPRLWLVGYGDWTGFASATLIGVGRSARTTVDEIVAASSIE